METRNTLQIVQRSLFNNQNEYVDTLSEYVQSESKNRNRAKIKEAIEYAGGTEDEFLNESGDTSWIDEMNEEKEDGNIHEWLAMYVIPYVEAKFGLHEISWIESANEKDQELIKKLS